MLRRSLAFVGLAIALSGVAGVACSSFSADDPPAGSADGGTDAPAVEPETGPGPFDSATESGPPVDTKIVLAAGYENLTGVAADETNAYFLAQTTGKVHVVRLAGGSVGDFASDPATPSPSGIVVVSGVVIWTDSATSALAKHQADGSGNTMVVPAVDGINPLAIAGTPTFGGRVVVSGVGPTTTGDVQQYDLTLSSSQELPLQQGLKNAYDVAINVDKVYWTETEVGKIWGGTVGGSPGAGPIALSEDSCESIAADALGIYWTKPSDGSIRAMFPPSTIVQNLALKQNTPFSIAADESGVYWLTIDGKLWRSNRNEAGPYILSQGFAATFPDRYGQAIALTKDYVVWISSDGKVFRRDK